VLLARELALALAVVRAGAQEATVFAPGDVEPERFVELEQISALTMGSR
jgi:hypothetical protein